MFTIEGVRAARNPAEATARYWLMRASVELSEGQRQLEAELHSASTGERMVTAEILDMLHVIEADPGEEAGLAAARLLMYQALYIGDRVDLGGKSGQLYGVRYTTDYKPIGRMAEVLKGHDARVVGKLPIKTETVAYPEFAYVREQGEPFTIVHGDIDVAQPHIVEAHAVPPSMVTTLSGIA